MPAGLPFGPRPTSGVHAAPARRLAFGVRHSPLPPLNVERCRVAGGLPCAAGRALCSLLSTGFPIVLSQHCDHALGCAPGPLRTVRAAFPHTAPRPTLPTAGLSQREIRAIRFSRLRPPPGSFRWGHDVLAGRQGESLLPPPPPPPLPPLPPLPPSRRTRRANQPSARTPAFGSRRTRRGWDSAFPGEHVGAWGARRRWSLWSSPSLGKARCTRETGATTGGSGGRQHRGATRGRRGALRPTPAILAGSAVPETGREGS